MIAYDPSSLLLLLASQTTFKVLDSISTSDQAFQQCLRKLQAICGHHMILPHSHTITGDLSRTGESAFAYGGFADVWEGDHAGNKVCIKALRVSIYDSNRITKVCTRHLHVFLFAEGNPVGMAAILQRGGRLETIKTPKYRTLPRCHD